MDDGICPGSLNADPLAVWDTRDRDGIWHQHWREGIEWAAQHINDPGSTYRAEFYLIDAPFAVLYRYREDERARRYIDPETGHPAAEEPVIQMLDTLPPRHLLTGC